MLPNLPDEIYETFVVPQNDAPLNAFDDHPLGRWFVHFGGLSINEFDKLRWRRTEFLFSATVFEPGTYSDIDRLIKHLKGVALSPRIPTNSRERVIWQRNVIKKTGRLFAPIVCMRTIKGLKVLDGSHRIVAALFLSVDGPEIPLDAWIGE